MKKAIGAVAAAVALGVGGLAVQRANADDKGGKRANPVAVAERRNLEIVAEASGLIEPVRVVEVKSKASGEVLRALVESGDRVEQGTLLAEIDPRDVQSALEQAQADLDAARVRASTTGAQRKRMESLRGSGFVTQQELETAVDSAATARAAVVRAETSLRLARERRQDVIIRAPISGTVLTRSVEPGVVIASATSNVSGGTALFEMADLSEMQVRGRFDEADIGQLSKDQEAVVTVEAYPGKKFIGRVEKIEPRAVIEQNVTLFPVLIRLDNREGLLRPGMNSEVQVRVASRQRVVSVPNASVVSAREARTVAKTLNVTPQATSNAPKTEVSAECTQLRERVKAAGGFTQMSSEDRAAMKACRNTQTEAGKAGVLFVQGKNGVEMRRVSLGLSDWENTEITNGLEAGEQVVLVSVAQLQEKQKQATDRMKQNASVVPGASAGRGGRRGG